MLNRCGASQASELPPSGGASDSLDDVLATEVMSAVDATTARSAIAHADRQRSAARSVRRSTPYCAAFRERGQFAVR
jgi:hypothetical protein